MSIKPITELNSDTSVIKKVVPITFFAVTCCIQSALAQAGTWEGSLQSINNTAWGQYVKPAIQIGLFIWFAIKVVQVFISRDKEHNWWEMLLMLGGILMCEFVDDVYLAITGKNAIGST